MVNLHPTILGLCGLRNGSGVEKFGRGPFFAGESKEVCSVFTLDEEAIKERPRNRDGHSIFPFFRRRRNGYFIRKSLSVVREVLRNCRYV